MGEKRELICPNCNYGVLTSGGLDRGFYVYTNTFVCLDCKSIIDVAVSESKHRNNLHSVEAPINPTQPVINECPKCKSNDLVIWNAEKRICPKCGTHLNVNGGIRVLWD